MLVELVVENYAVVERLRVRFHRGLNLLTGETGSGKSIVVDALGLLLGGRASAEMIRSGAGRARISGRFARASDMGRYRLLVDGKPLVVTPAHVRQQMAVMEECHRQNPLPPVPGIK